MTKGFYFHNDVYGYIVLIYIHDINIGNMLLQVDIIMAI